MIDVLFYGPGTSLDWVGFSNQIRGQQARDLGVPANVIREAQIQAVGQKFNFAGLSHAFVDEKLRRRIQITAVLYATAAIPWLTRAVLARLPSSVGAGAVGSRAAIFRAGTIRALSRRGLSRLALRVIPYIGWIAIGYDIYTVVTRGELWGVPIFTEA